LAPAPPLGAEEAVRQALANNPSARAAYESVGIARAEVLQAGLLANPRLESFVRFSDQPVATNRLVGGPADVLDPGLRPRRRRGAEERLAGEQQRVADALWRLSAEVKTAWFTAVGAGATLALQGAVTEAAGVAAELAGRQRTAGNISALDLAAQQ